MTIELESMTEEQFLAYRDRCAERSCAEFRYMRECCGIELAELADELGVRLDTAKRWENPNKGKPPSLRAWAYMDTCYAELLDAVDAAISQVEGTERTYGEPNAVHLAYRRGKRDARGGITIGRANALARAAGIALTTLGYEVAIDWADEDTAGPVARVLGE